jgi:hypothetical protein
MSNGADHEDPSEGREGDRVPFFCFAREFRQPGFVDLLQAIDDSSKVRGLQSNSLRRLLRRHRRGDAHRRARPPRRAIDEPQTDLIARRV